MVFISQYPLFVVARGRNAYDRCVAIAGEAHASSPLNHGGFLLASSSMPLALLSTDTGHHVKV